MGSGQTRPRPLTSGSRVSVRPAATSAVAARSPRMDLLIYVLIFLLIAAIVWYVIGQLSLPPPIRMVAIVVMAIVAILFLVQLLPGGASHLSLR